MGTVTQQWPGLACLAPHSQGPCGQAADEAPGRLHLGLPGSVWARAPWERLSVNALS